MKVEIRDIKQQLDTFDFVAACKTTKETHKLARIAFTISTIQLSQLFNYLCYYLLAYAFRSYKYRASVLSEEIGKEESVRVACTLSFVVTDVSAETQWKMHVEGACWVKDGWYKVREFIKRRRTYSKTQFSDRQRGRRHAALYRSVQKSSVRSDAKQPLSPVVYPVVYPAHREIGQLTA